MENRTLRSARRMLRALKSSTALVTGKAATSTVGWSAVTLAMVMTGAMPTAGRANGTYLTTNNGYWDNPTDPSLNWDNAITPNNPGDFADVGTNGTFSVNLQTNTYTMGTLDISSGSTLSNGTINMDNNGSDATINTSGTGYNTINTNLTLSDATTVQVDPGADLGIVGVIDDGAFSYGLTKSGAGTLTLGQDSTYDGGTTVAGGTLSVQSGGGLGSGAVTVNDGATLQLAPVMADTYSNALALAGTGIGGVDGALNIDTNYGDVSLTGAVTVGSGTSIVTNGMNSATFGGAISGTNADLVFDGSNSVAVTKGIDLGTGTLTKNGTGTLLLNEGGSFSFSEAVVNGGQLRLGAALQASTGLTVNGANVTVLTDETIGALNGTGTVDLGSNKLSVGNDNGDSSYSGKIIGGAGSLTKAGTGTLTLTGSNTYGGGTTVAGGTLSVQSGGGLGSGAVTVNDGATLQLGTSTSSTTSYDNNLDLSGTGGGNGALNLDVSNGSIELKGAVTVASGTSITTSGYDARFDNTLTGTDANVTFDGDGMLTLQNGINIGAGTLTKNGYGNVAIEGFGTGSVFSEAILNQGSLTLSGPLSGNPNMTVNGGQLYIFGNETIGDLGGTGGIVNITNNQNLTVGSTSGSSKYSGEVSGAGSLTKAGTGTLTLSGANTYSGGTSLSAGGIVLGSSTALGSGTVTAEDGTKLGYGDAINVANAITANGSLTLTTDGAATQSGVISGVGAVTKAGAGTLTLSGENTYGGGTTVSGGTLEIASGGVVGSVTVTNRNSFNVATGGSAGDVTNYGTFNVASGGSAGAVTNKGTGESAGTIASLTAGVGSFTNSGVVVGATLIKSGGAVTLAAGSDLSDTAGVTLTGGELQVSATDTVDTLTNGGIVTVGGDVAGNLNVKGDVTNKAGSTIKVMANGTLTDALENYGTVDNSGTYNADVNNYSTGVITNSGTWNGDVLSNAGQITNNGTWTGDVRSNSNTITLGDGSTITGNVANAGGTLALAADASATIGGNLSGGTVSMQNDAATQALTVSGTTSGPLTFDLDVDTDTAKSDTLALNGGSGTATMNYKLLGTTKFASPITVISGTNLDALTYSATGLSNGAVVVSQQVTPTAVTLVAQSNPAIGGTVSGFTQVQSLMGVVIDRPAPSFDARPKGADQCGGGNWARVVGGYSKGTASTSNGVSDVPSRTRIHYQGMQVGSDFGCGQSAGGMTLRWGAMAGINSGTTAQDVYAVDPTNPSRLSGTVTSTTQSDFSQAYAGVYLAGHRDGLGFDLQLRKTHSDFNLDDPTFFAAGTDAGLNTTTLSGDISYTRNIGNGLSVMPEVGLGLSRTADSSLSYRDGTLETPAHDGRIAYVGATLRKLRPARSDGAQVGGYVSGKVYHDFSSDVASTFTPTGGTTQSEMRTGNLGTFGEVSLGLDYSKPLAAGTAGPAGQLGASLGITGQFSGDVHSVGLSAKLRVEF